jgi:hypothetical protein
MKKEYVLGILLFSGLWGLSEALLGGALYGSQIPYASVPLTLIAFAILTIATMYMPMKGTATAIALCAMLYKFLNEPFFACHLLGIAMVGVCYDVFFSFIQVKNKSVSAFAAAIVNYALFAFMMTYIFNNGFWNTSKLTGHIFEGLLAAGGCAIIVPVIMQLGTIVKNRIGKSFDARWNPATGIALASAFGLWAFSIAAFFQR